MFDSDSFQARMKVLDSELLGQLGNSKHKIARLSQTWKSLCLHQSVKSESEPSEDQCKAFIEAKLEKWQSYSTGNQAHTQWEDFLKCFKQTLLNMCSIVVSKEWPVLEEFFQGTHVMLTECSQKETWTTYQFSQMEMKQFFEKLNLAVVDNLVKGALVAVMYAGEISNIENIIAMTHGMVTHKSESNH